MKLIFPATALLLVSLSGAVAQSSPKLKLASQSVINQSAAQPSVLLAQTHSNQSSANKTTTSQVAQANTEASSESDIKSPNKAVILEMHWSAAEPILLNGKVERPTTEYIADLPMAQSLIDEAVRLNSLEPLRDRLQEAYKKIEERQPKDIRFSQNKAAEWFGQAQTGWIVKKEETEQSVLAALKAGRLKSTVFLNFAAPKRSVHWAAKQGLRYLGSGISSFAGSPDFRIKNIRVGSSRVDNYWIGAGEEFNFNRTIGPITQKAGFALGYVIKGNSLVKEEGGGLCQVSTTVFRAALNAGLPITERHEHSYQVSYYGKPGYDAAVYAPLKNLRWKNDTGGMLMMQVDWNPDEGLLMVSLFGQKDGRKVKVSQAVQRNIKQPPAPRYVADPNLKAGQTRRIDLPMPGSQVFVQRTVTYPDGRQQLYKVNSTYVPWAGSIAVPASDARVKR